MPIISEEYLKDSVRSICKQSYKHWELIILAYDPLKKIYEIVNKFNDPRIHLVKLATDLGMLEAFSTGLNLSRGHYIIRHDPDDISLPKRVELQVRYLEEHNEVGMVSCCIKAFTKDSSYKRQCKNINRVQNFYKTKEDIDDAFLRGNYPIIFPTIMIRRDLFRNNSILNTKPSFEDEIKIVLNLLKEGSIEKIDKVLYYYRRHRNAYHNINNIDPKVFLRAAFDDMELTNSIKFREFHKELVSLKVEKLHSSQSSIFRVLMLVDELNIGGTETYIFNLTKALIKMGVYIVIASSGGIAEELFKLHGIKTFRISINIKLKALEGLKHLIDIERINLLHCHLIKSMELGAEIYKRYNISYLITLHGMFYSKEILLATCINAKAIIAVSNPVRNLFLESLETKFQGILKVIANGIDTETFKPVKGKKTIRKNLGIPEDAVVILYCSRLGWGKGAVAEQVLSKFKEISLKNSNIYCIIMGEGDKKKSIIRMAEELNISLNRKAIHVIGARYDVLLYYLESDLVIGTGRVALEALSCERAVIATGSIGCVGIVSEENKEEMWNVYFGDHQGLADADNSILTKSLENLIALPGRSLELGKWGRKWCIEKFEIGKITSEIISLYYNILKS
ncbi:MAG: glycosyltransferase [Clostridiaceae bacterium]|nr:glycosyltransferase [Clostridiaceae bacterium]